MKYYIVAQNTKEEVQKTPSSELLHVGLLHGENESRGGAFYVAQVQ
jgi:hypothetical protein